MKRSPLNPGKGFGPRTTPLGRNTAPAPSSELSRSPMPRASAPGRAGRTARRRSDVDPKVRAKVYERDGHCCVRCGKPVGPGNRQLQHRLARGRGGRSGANVASNLVLLCGFSATDPDGCHTWVEANPDDARRLGYRVPLDAAPSLYPVLRFEKWVFLNDDGDVLPCGVPDCNLGAALPGGDVVG